MLKFELPWDSQPQEAVEVDSSKNEGLLGLWNLNSLGSQNAIRGGFGKTAGSAPGVTVVARTAGLGLTNVGNNSTFELLRESQAIGTADYWLMATITWGNYVLTGSSYNVIAWYGTDLTVAGAGLYTDSSNKLYFGMAALGTSVVTPAALTVGRRYVALVHSVGGTCYAYLDGVLIGSASKSTPNETSSTRFVVCADVNPAQARGWFGTVHQAAIGRSTLTAGYAAWATANPWQLFAPRSIWIPVSAGGGGTTISGALGTATASGIAGTVDANRTIAGSVGVASALGIQGGVSQSSDTTVTGTVGVATASGIAGGVDANRTIAGVVGVATAEGLQGTVSNTNDTVVTGSVGTATASGVAGTVAWNRTLAGIVGEAIASGVTGGVQSGPVDAAPVGGGGYLPSFRRKTRKEIHAERVRLGILPEQIRQAAKKVVEKAAEQGDPEEVYEDNTEKYKAMFLREVGATKWAPDYARAIRIQLELMERDAEDALLLM